MSSKPRPGQMVAFAIPYTLSPTGWSRRTKRMQAHIGLLHRWSGRDDAHLSVICLDKKGNPGPPARLYVDQVVVLTGYDDLQQQIITAIATTRKGRKAATVTEDTVPTQPALTGEPQPRPTQRGRLDMHDIPYRTADIESDYDYETATSARGWNRDIDRYLTDGGRARDAMRAMRDDPGRMRYFRDVIAPNSHGQRRKANLHALVAAA